MWCRTLFARVLPQYNGLFFGTTTIEYAIESPLENVMRFIRPIRTLIGVLLTFIAASAVAGMPSLAATDSTESIRKREVLEKYSIESLRYVGTLSHEDCWDGLLRTPDNLVHRVRVGSHVGQHGRVIAITQDGITIMDVVVNDAGDATERKIELKSENLRSQPRSRLLIF